MTILAGGCTGPRILQFIDQMGNEFAIGFPIVGANDGVIGRAVPTPPLGLDSQCLGEPLYDAEGLPVPYFEDCGEVEARGGLEKSFQPMNYRVFFRTGRHRSGS
jgi:hypothetical protein